MKYLKQFTIIIFITFVGEMLHHVLPLSVPGSIYGLVLLFLCLELGVVKAESIRESAMWLLEMIPVMFVPAGAGLLKSWGELRSILWQATVITLVSTVAVMAVSGRVTQRMMGLRGQKAAGGEESHLRDNK